MDWHERRRPYLARREQSVLASDRQERPVLLFASQMGSAVFRGGGIPDVPLLEEESPVAANVREEIG